MGDVGAIFYFDEDGRVEGRVKPFSTAPFNSDVRNGSPSPSNAFLCDRVLCYIWKDRDIGGLRVDAWILGETDDLATRFDDLEKWFNSGKRSVYGSYFESEVLYERWLSSICKETEKRYCLHLKSIRK